jgi:hypothetical protein
MYRRVAAFRHGAGICKALYTRPIGALPVSARELGSREARNKSHKPCSGEEGRTRRLRELGASALISGNPMVPDKCHGSSKVGRLIVHSPSRGGDPAHAQEFRQTHVRQLLSS